MPAITSDQLKNAFEIVYINGGEIYKAPSDKEAFLQYGADDEADPIFPFRKYDGKRYFVAQEFKEFFGNIGPSGISMERHNACPHVRLWCGLGARSPDDTQNCDVFFSVDSTAQLRAIAQFYGLPYPVSNAVGNVIDTAPDTINWKNAGGKPIVLGAVKFINGAPSLLKLYTYPKPFGTWDVWMYGASYHDAGKCWEKGAVYTKETGGADLPGAQMRGDKSFRKAEVIYAERADGVRTSYAYTRDQDRFMFWQGNEIRADGSIEHVKRYESSQMVRKMIGRVKKGPDFAEFDLCPEVGFWLGRSWYDEKDEQELLFAAADGSATFEAAAAHYGLPVPYSAEQKLILDSQPELYRARHYDLLGLGEGGYVPVVVGSVTFVAGKASRLLLYTFMRPWDFDEKIQLPAFPS